MQTKIGTQIQRPAWLNPALYPFEGHMVTIDGNHVHYVDEGEGPVLLLLHGNPTWSFLYRDLINALHGAFRCIALDYPALGYRTPRPTLAVNLTIMYTSSSASSTCLICVTSP
jgi:haloalkane dehalogenase